MGFSLPSIVKLAERLLLEVNQAVSRFARANKFTFGANLREHAMQICMTTHRAWRDLRNRAQWVARLVWQVDDLKILLQLGHQLRAFASSKQFEMLSRLAREIGKQTGGWNRQLNPKGQSADAISALPQRAEILSARAASIAEANT